MTTTNNTQNESKNANGKVFTKVLTARTTYAGKPARIACTVTNKDGYISITGELTPYRCRTPHAAGCIHEEIEKAFPKLRPFIWLHLANLDGSVMHEIENSLYMIANDDEKAAQNVLHCTDDEINELSALVHNGLHRSPTWWSYKDGQKGYQIKGEDSRRIYAEKLESLNLRARRLAAINDLYDVLSK